MHTVDPAHPQIPNYGLKICEFLDPWLVEFEDEKLVEGIAVCTLESDILTAY